MHWNWRLQNNSLKSWTKCRINKYNLSKFSSEKLYLPKMNVKHSKSSKTQNGTSMLCFFSVFMGHITEGKLVFTLCVEPYYICTELVNGCYSVCCEKLPQVLELSIHFFFSLFFFYSSRFDRIYCHWPNCLKSIFSCFHNVKSFYSIVGNIIFNTSRKMHLPLQYGSTQKSKLIKVLYK